MKQCYEYLILGISERNENDNVIKTDNFDSILIPDEAEEELNRILDKYDMHSLGLIWQLETTFKRTGYWPWAIVFFEEEFRLAGHVVSIRDYPRDFSFAYYTMPVDHTVEEHGVPSVSFLLVNTKMPLKKLAMKSELFEKAWDQLANCEEEKRWVCIAETPSKEWIEKTSKNDDELFLNVLGIK